MGINMKILSAFIIMLFFLPATSSFANLNYNEGVEINQSRNHVEVEERNYFIREINREDLKSAKPLSRPKRHALEPEDEGPHFHRLLQMREWWYFNVIFDKPDSELKNWSAMISFNHQSKPFRKPDILFITLYDDTDKTYGGMINRERGALQATGPGVNVTFEDSWVKGRYPSWHLYAEDDEADENHEIIFNLSFEAETLPYWVLMNTGRGVSWSLLGYYSINSCDVKGKVTMDGRTYKVHGTGYHDHTWVPFIIGEASYFWDWFSVHFDNGLHAFIWNIIPLNACNSKSFNPTFCWITDGQNFTDVEIFITEYLEFENTSFPHFKRPKLFHISSNLSDLKIDLYLKTKNMHEYLWGEITLIDIGLWEGTAAVHGTLTIGDNTMEVKGSAISEILRII
jgi:predicted secreted hydrolase